MASSGNIPGVGPSQNGFMISRGSFCLRLFQMESTKDLVVISGSNGAGLRAHRLIVGAQSPTLTAMMTPGGTWGGIGLGDNGGAHQEWMVELPQNSENGVSHLLRYLCGLPITTEELTCDLAVELFKTAHQYKLTQLQDDLEAMISRMSGDWYKPGEVLELYLYLKGTGEEEFETFRETLFRVMTGMRDKLRECEGYEKLTRGELEHLWKLPEVGRKSVPTYFLGHGIRINRDSFCQNLFMMESTKDLTLVAGNGAEFKCHKMIFGAQSPALEAMVAPYSGMLEAQTGRVEMRHNSEEGLGHLLRYLYGLQIITKKLTCDVAVELFITAHQYQLTELQDDLETEISGMGKEWYKPDDILELYFHLKDLEELGTFRDNMLKIMTSIRDKIRTCERYQGLDHGLERELFWKLFDGNRNLYVPPPPIFIPPTPSPKWKKKREDFSQCEDRLIVQKLLEAYAFRYTRGRKLWEQMAKLEEFQRSNRSGQSLRGRYVNYLAKKWFEDDDGGQKYFDINISPDTLTEIKRIEKMDRRHNNVCPDNLFGC